MVTKSDRCLPRRRPQNKRKRFNLRIARHVLLQLSVGAGNGFEGKDAGHGKGVRQTQRGLPAIAPDIENRLDWILRSESPQVVHKVHPESGRMDDQVIQAAQQVSKEWFLGTYPGK